jgi:hypothetical protein
MRRTMIIGAIGATALTIGLGVGSTLAASDPTPPLPVASVTMTGTHMNDVNDMTSMMTGNGMTNMMDAKGMDSMHASMHQALEGSVSADVLAACDGGHASMRDAQAPSSTDQASNHAAHHPGGQP